MDLSCKSILYLYCFLIDDMYMYMLYCTLNCVVI